MNGYDGIIGCAPGCKCIFPRDRDCRDFCCPRHDQKHGLFFLIKDLGISLAYGVIHIVTNNMKNVCVCVCLKMGCLEYTDVYRGQHSEHEGLLDGLEPQRSRRFVFFAVGYTTWLIESQIVYLGNL